MKPVLIVVGLGNPGAQYDRTRHNAGYLAVDMLVEEFGEGEFEPKQKFSSQICEGRVGVAPVLFVKPETYMNRSGEAIRKIIEFYKLDPSNQLVVLSDDIDIPLAELRLRKSGGPGTHNGLKSIVDIYGESFPRIRIGLGDNPSGSDLASWVLSTMTADEHKALTDAYEKLPEMIREFVMESDS